MPSQSVISCSKLISSQNLRITFAESATAGRLAYEFSMTADSGSILVGGLVCYDAIVKEKILGIDPALIDKFTPESAEITQEMALRLRNLIESDIQVAITGLTTPGGSESEDKPVRTIFVHLLISGRSVAVRRVFQGSLEDIVFQAVELTAQLLIDELKTIPV